MHLCFINRFLEFYYLLPKKYICLNFFKTRCYSEKSFLKQIIKPSFVNEKIPTRHTLWNWNYKMIKGTEINVPGEIQIGTRQAKCNFTVSTSITTNLWFKIMGGINEQALVCVTLSLWSRWHEPLPPIVNGHQIRHLPFAFCPKFNWCKGMSSRSRTNSTRIELEKLLNWGAAFRSFICHLH